MSRRPDTGQFVPTTLFGEALADDNTAEARRILKTALHRNAGNVQRTARALGVSHRYLYFVMRKLKAQGLVREVRDFYARRYRLPEIAP